MTFGRVVRGSFVVAVLVACACSSSSGSNSQQSSGCHMDANGCSCSPGSNTTTCGRSQIPTDPGNFRHDLYFVTPCCESAGWPQSGSCTCEDRVGVSCFEGSNGSCQCGNPGDNLGSGGTVAPSPTGTLSKCTAPSGGMCCAIPGPDPNGPQLTCVCFPTSASNGCAAVTLPNGDPAGAVSVAECDGSNVFNTTCPDGTTQTPECSSTSSSGGSGGGSKPECSSDSDCSSCSSKCSSSCYQCLSGSCNCGYEGSDGCVF